MRIKNIKTNEIAKANEDLRNAVTAAAEAAGIHVNVEPVFSMDRWGAKSRFDIADGEGCLEYGLVAQLVDEEPDPSEGQLEAYTIAGSLDIYSARSMDLDAAAEHVQLVTAAASIFAQVNSAVDGNIYRYEVEFEQPTLQGTHITVDRENLKGALEAKDENEGLYITMTPDAEVWEATDRNDTGWTSSSLSPDDKTLGWAEVYDVKRVRVFFKIGTKEYQVQMKNVTAARIRNRPTVEESEE